MPLIHLTGDWWAPGFNARPKLASEEAKIPSEPMRLLAMCLLPRASGAANIN